MKFEAFKRWYSFNKEKIPMYFFIVGTIFFTAFLDFNVQKTPIRLQSHITAIQRLSSSTLNNLSAFFLFVAFLLAVIQAFNAITYAKKNNLAHVILMTVLMIVHIVIVALYVYTFIRETQTRPTYSIRRAEITAMTVFSLGILFNLIGLIFAWKYVNYDYIAVKDE